MKRNITDCVTEIMTKRTMVEQAYKETHGEVTLVVGYPQRNLAKVDVVKPDAKNANAPGQVLNSILIKKNSNPMLLVDQLGTVPQKRAALEI